MTDAIFAYGTLEMPEVMMAVTGRRLPSQPAILPGYERYMVRGECFPGVVTAAGGSTDGTLYLGIDAATRARLDRYEGDLYRRCEVMVTTSGGRQRSAWAWVIPNEKRALLSSEKWDAHRFRTHHMTAFIERFASRGRSR